MPRLVFLLSLSAALHAAGAQQPDTIVLSVGHPAVDGTMYKEHWATASRSLVTGGAVSRSLRYRSHTYTTRRNGVPVCIVTAEPYPGAADHSFFEQTILDARTMAILHREERDGTGHLLMADVDRAHVTGRFRASKATPEETFDFTLDTPSFYAPFIDAAIGATQIRAGQVWRVPAFSFAPTGRKTEWHTFHIVGHEPVPALSETVLAWIIEEDAPVRSRVWITDEPPYLPQVLRFLADGSIARSPRA